MDSVVILVSLCGLLAAAFIGIPLAYALAIASVMGAYLTTGSWDTAFSMMGQTAFGGIREYVLAVVTMFTVMGMIIERSGAAVDLFSVANRWLRGVPARLAVATVAGNAVFSAVTGVGIASTATFSRVAYPAMRSHHYNRRFALGSIAGSAVLGMLIPPSVLMVVWALMTEQSVGKLYLAALIPGILLTAFFAAYCMIAALREPSIAPPPAKDDMAERTKAATRSEWIGAGGVALLVVLMMGGLWGGLFNATEAGAMGMLGAFILGWAKGMTFRQMWRATLDAGPLIAPLMVLIIAAQMYSKLLALEGTTEWLKSVLEGANIGVVAAFATMIVLWLVLGTLLDSMSTLLLSVPIFWPIAMSYGIDPFVFCLVGILIIEVGILTPPLGMAVFVVKASVPESVTLNEIYRGAYPFCALTVLLALLLIVFPEIATAPIGWFGPK